MIQHLLNLSLTEGDHIQMMQAKRHKNNTKYEYIYIFHKQSV
jgi:hypothetical protein